MLNRVSSVQNIQGKSDQNSRGFTLIELVITVAVLGILAAAAVPAFQTWVQDTKTRTVAESLQNGIRLAQVEAVRRGRQVTFFLTNATPDTSASSSGATTTGKNWVIKSMTLANKTTEDEFIQGAAMAGLSGSVVVTASNAGIRFNSIGRLDTPAADVTYEIRNANGKRRLNVTVSLAGKVRMCDYDKTLSATHPDGC